MKTPNLTKLCGSIKTVAMKRSPEILTGIGIAGMITTAVMAVKATPKALMLIEEEKRHVNYEILEEAKVNGYEECQRIDHLKPIDLVKTSWKCYIPAAITGTMSVACLIGASSANAKRNAALATAYTLSESTLRDYQKKVVETIGEKKEQSVRDAVAKDRIEKTPVTTREVIVTEKGNALCLDYVSGRYFRSDRDTINRAINELNRRLRDEMYISLNDFYYELGLSSTGLGDQLGWNIDNGYIEPDFSSQLADDGTPCLVISYLVEPRYDYR